MRIQIDFYQLCLNLDPEKRVPVEKAVAERFLRSLGLRKEAGWWVADSDSAVNWLELNEIHFIKEQEDVGISDWSDADRQAFVTRFQQRLLERQHIDVKLPPGQRGKYLVPALLVGRHRDVMRRWTAVARKAVKAGHWGPALADVEMVPLEDTPGELIVNGPSLLNQGDNVLLYCVPEGLNRAARHKDRVKRYLRQRALVLEGMDLFWFCLSVLYQRWLWIRCAQYEAEEPRIMWESLKKVMRWWQAFCLFDAKFPPESLRPNDNSRHWYSLVGYCAINLGFPQDEFLALQYGGTPEALGRAVEKWMEGQTSPRTEVDAR